MTVDDLMIFSNSIELTNQLKDQLNRTFKMKDLGELEQVLGVRIKKETGRLMMESTKGLSAKTS